MDIQLEPAVFCLLASLIWAPAVYIAATGLDRDRSLRMSETLWIVALAVAAMPTLIAPAFAAAGISLRPAPAAFQLATVYAVEAAAAGLTKDADVAVDAAANPGITANAIFDAAALLYVYGVLLAFGVWLTRSLIFAAHVRRAAPIDHPELIVALQPWRRRLGVAPALHVRVSDAVSSVCVYGLFRPVIIVPADLNARVSFDDLVMMCAHELAHVKRGDCGLFSACAAARILFWFNPFLKRIAGRAELAAERSADGLVLDAGADRRAYAACFVEGLRFAAERARSARVEVPSFTPFDKKSRRDRLDAILSGETAARRTPSRLAIGLAASLAGALAFAQAALAVHPDTERSEPDASPLPVDGEVSLPYGAAYNDDLGSRQPAHQGVDIKSPKGAPVVAYDDGVVVDATDLFRNKPGYGKVVEIRHDNDVVTRYAHLDRYDVRKGERVIAGQKIGEVGESGKVSGPHLHFEALVDGVIVDPKSIPAAKFADRARTPKSAKLAAKIRTPAPIMAPVAPDSMLPPAAAPQFAAAPALEGPAPAAPGRLYFGDPNGDPTIVSRNFKWAFADDGGLAFEFDNSFSEDERRALEKSMKKMRKQIESAKKAHAKAMTEIRFNVSRLNFDLPDLSDLGAIATIDASDAAAVQNHREIIMEALETARQRASVDWEQIIQERWRAAENRWQAESESARVRHDTERAARDAEERAREHAQRDVERERDRTERAREQARERAERNRDRTDAEREAAEERRAAYAEARIEREEAWREAAEDEEGAMPETRIVQEKMLRRRAEALDDVERKLSEERVEIERLRASLDRLKSRHGD